MQPGPCVCELSSANRLRQTPTGGSRSPFPEKAGSKAKAAKVTDRVIADDQAQQDRMDKHHYLERLVFKLETHVSLPAVERRKLLDLPLTLKRFDAGQDIVREGELTKQCCLVAEGLVCRYKIVGDGLRQILSLHLPAIFRTSIPCSSNAWTTAWVP